MIFVWQLILTYLLPVALLLFGVIATAVILAVISRMGGKPDPDPAIRAVLERRKGPTSGRS
jgi:hypothetical protein